MLETASGLSTPHSPAGLEPEGEGLSDQVCTRLSQSRMPRHNQSPTSYHAAAFHQYKSRAEKSAVSNVKKGRRLDSSVFVSPEAFKGVTVMESGY